MRSPAPAPVLAHAIALALLTACASPRTDGGTVATSAQPPSGLPAFACDPGNGGITLPDGFCALVFADRLEAPRHLVVAANGDVFVALNDRRSGQEVRPGGVVALRDTDGDGRADTNERWAVGGGSGIAIAHGHLYHGKNDAIVRYPLAGELIPSGPPDTIVSGLPVGGHAAKSLVIRGNDMFVNIGSRTNACQVQDRTAKSPGHDPCRELETRAGTWRFDAQRSGQTQQDGERWATGVRNGYALALHPGGELYAMQHGRDQLAQNWPDLFTEAENAEKPAEELLRLRRGADYGWPYCYYDPHLRQKVLAPEYGGDGRAVGRCAQAEPPVFAFPAHWAPNDLLFYTGAMFPPRYRNGAFIAFHGSWNRAPLPQAGYNVVFLPASGDGFAAEFSVFADGFAGANREPREAAHRPTGLAQGPDGSLYVSDDAGGRIWRIVTSR